MLAKQSPIQVLITRRAAWPASTYRLWANVGLESSISEIQNGLRTFECRFLRFVYTILNLAHSKFHNEGIAEIVSSPQLETTILKQYFLSTNLIFRCKKSYYESFALLLKYSNIRAV